MKIRILPMTLYLSIMTSLALLFFFIWASNQIIAPNQTLGGYFIIFCYGLSFFSSFCLIYFLKMLKPRTLYAEILQINNKISQAPILVNDESIIKQLTTLILQIMLPIMIGVIFAWIISVTGKIMLWIISIGSFIVVLRYIKDSWEAIFFIYGVIAPMQLFQISYGSELIAIFLDALLLYGVSWGMAQKKRFPKTKTYFNSFWKLLKPLRETMANIEKKFYSNSTIVEFQSTIIFIVILVFIIIPLLARVMPEEARKQIQSYVQFIKDFKANNSIVAFLIYCVISITPTLKLVRKLFVSTNNNLMPSIINFVTTIGIYFAIVILFGVLSIIFGLTIVLIGETMIGKDFAIILGFFVFPTWSTKFYIVLTSLIIIIMPQSLIAKANFAYE